MNLSYRLVPTNFSMVLNVAFDVLSPNDRVIIIRFKEFRNKFGPRFYGVKPFLAKNTGQVPLDGNNGSGGEVVTENTE